MAAKKTVEGVEKLLVKNVRLSYVVLDKPTKMKKDGVEVGKPKYRVTLMIPKGDTATYKAVQAALQTALDNGLSEQLWDAKATKGKLFMGVEDRIQDGDDFDSEDFHGHWLVTASAMANSKPTLFRGAGEKLTELDDVNELFYSGMWAKVIISTWAYNNLGQGISVGLKGVMWVKDDEKLGGSGGATASDFDDDDDLD